VGTLEKGLYKRHSVMEVEPDHVGWHLFPGYPKDHAISLYLVKDWFLVFGKGLVPCIW